MMGQPITTWRQDHHHPHQLSICRLLLICYHENKYTNLKMLAKISRKLIHIKLKTTPNPHSLMFFPLGRIVTGSVQQTLEFETKDDAVKWSPLAV